MEKGLVRIEKYLRRQGSRLPWENFLHAKKSWLTVYLIFAYLKGFLSVPWSSRYQGLSKTL